MGGAPAMLGDLETGIPDERAIGEDPERPVTRLRHQPRCFRQEIGRSEIDDALARTGLRHETLAACHHFGRQRHLAFG
jgi:hypothetical protein